MMRPRAAIVGGSGYVGGELLRLLLDHPHVEVTQVTSESQAGKFVYSVHPNLRGKTALRFLPLAEFSSCDLVFACLPHGGTMTRTDALYECWYSEAHTAPDWLPRFTYGLPELHREALRRATHVSGVGCNAAATILALYPLFKSEAVNLSRDVVVEVKVGSSEGGNQESPASHHPERSHAVRSYAPVGHRHTAEVIQELSLGKGTPSIHLSVTAVDLVRGVLATGHVFLREHLTEQDLWALYRDAYNEEPFVRIVRQRHGIHRAPEPKILASSNYCDVGFSLDEKSGRVVTLAALDNLMKGAASSAVQSMNPDVRVRRNDGLELSRPASHLARKGGQMTLVVKVGGGAQIDLGAVCDDLASLVKEGQKIVLVHGGADEMNRIAAQLGHPPQFVTSPSGHVSRRTDKRTLEVFEMVYCGKVNKGIVERLQRRGVNAVGLSGLDGRLLQGRRKTAIRIVEDNRVRILRDDYSGKVEHVNTGLLRLLLDTDYLPVLTPPAISMDDEAINVDADRAAAAVAAALRAETLILLSNVPGLLQNFPDEDSLVPTLKWEQLDEAMALAQGRMKKKVMAAQEALEAGVAQVILGDARRANPIRTALTGTGTVFQ